MRRQHNFARMFHPQPLANVFKFSTDGERGGGQHSTFELRPQAFAQDGANIDWSSLQENVLATLLPLFGFLCAGACPERSRRASLGELFLPGPPRRSIQNTVLRSSDS